MVKARCTSPGILPPPSHPRKNPQTRARSAQSRARKEAVPPARTSHSPARGDDSFETAGGMGRPALKPSAEAGLLMIVKLTLGVVSDAASSRWP
jgi:hypothetical protein